jgi:hypothetical protein
MEAERAGGHLEWLGVRERLVFANTLSAGLASTALQNLVEGLATAIDVLENGSGRRAAAAKKVARQLRALIASGGHTSDPRRIPESSNQRLEPPSQKSRGPAATR